MAWAGAGRAEGGIALSAGPFDQNALHTIETPNGKFDCFPVLLRKIDGILDSGN